MLRRRFGSMPDEVPIIGQGTWKMEGDRREDCVAALLRGLDLGMTHIDTAELYGYGAAERIVAEAIRGRRDEVFLVSKVMPQNASRRGVRTACEKTLANLETDHLDVYLLHWPGSHPLAETLAGFADLAQAGKIRGFGVSNFDVAELEAAVRIAGPGKIVCNQVLYHPGERDIEHRVIPLCARHEVAVVAYTPFGQDRIFSPKSDGGRVLSEIAKARGASPRQVALAWVVRDPHVLTIPKASRVAHVEDNAGAGELALTPDEVALIDAAFPLGPARRGVSML
jgi:diketogulonate reductase-like aldo/keto reductase